MPGRLDAEVIIAGAGPAGIATAVALARRRPDLADAGQIICFDKARFPREKPCGGGLTGHAQAALDALGLAMRVPAVACRVGRIVYGAEARAVPLARPVDVVRREEFDADLVAQARERGVTVVEGEAVTSHSADLARKVVSVTTSRNRVCRARVLVAADGAGSRIRRQLWGEDSPSQADAPPPPARGRWLPARPLRLFKAEIPAPRSFGDAMIYDFSAMDSGLRGYVWLFPVAGGRLNVGVMHTPGRLRADAGGLDSPELLRILQVTLDRYGITLPSTARGWPAWPYAPRARLAGPHVLCVGDAAGIDALTGEGIAVGLEHGLIAADSIGDALASGDFSFASYAPAVRRATVGRELALDRHLARRLYASAGFRFWLALVMFDGRVRDLYASRVCGSEVLADRAPALFAALARHLVAAPFRLRRLARASATRRRSGATP